MFSRFLVFLVLISCLSGCFFGTEHKNIADDGGKLIQPIEATGFELRQYADYQKLTVINPWQKSSNTQFDYFLLEKGKEIPQVLKGKQLFFTPVKNVICLSTTHIGFLDALGEIKSVTGISGGGYLTNQEIRNGLEKNIVHEIGYDRGLNYEMIVQLKPDLVFAFGVGSEISAQVNKLKDIGIPVVLVGEYLEESPLGKAEWIKFFGSFYQKEKDAENIWNKIKMNYDAVRIQAAQTREKPSVLTGLPFKDTWWIAGGHSSLAVLIRDAGGKFLWEENPSKEAFPVSLEEVFVRATKADYWINCGSANSMEELKAFDPRFSDLPAVKTMQVYNNNLRSTTGGGNDYWESGVVHPDLILLDLLKIFHPELAGKNAFSYYQKLR